MKNPHHQATGITQKALSILTINMYNKLYLAFFHALMKLRRGVCYGQSKPILAAKSELVLLFLVVIILDIKKLLAMVLESNA